jgi:hypothetical protein
VENFERKISMKTRLISIVVITLALLLLPVAAAQSYQAPPQTDAPLSTAFTYQGTLTDNGQPANGTYDFRIDLYDAADVGVLLGTLTLEDITVTRGTFTVQLDYGSGVFNGQARWLEIAVRPGISTDTFTTLTPRQALTAAPYAHFARQAPWSGITGKPDFLTTLSAGPGLIVTGTNTALTVTADFSGTGTTAWVARADHDHDARYAFLSHSHPGDQITSPVAAAISATQALLANQVPWSGITDKPDFLTTIAAGPGLIVTGTTDALTVTADFAGTGATDRVARSDHDHDSRYAFLSHTHPGDQITSPVAKAISATHALNADQALSAAQALTATSSHNADLLAGQPASSYTYSAGLGLDLNNNQFSVNTQTMQLRVNNTCNPAQTIRAINPDGSVVCQTIYPNNGPTPNVFRIFDSNVRGDPIENSGNVILGQDGLPFFTYYSTQAQYFNVVHCNNLDCTDYVRTTPLRSLGYYVGEKTSVILGPDGLPLISINVGNNNPGLIYLRCTNLDCTTYTTALVNTDAVIWNSISLGGDGLPLIVYISSVDGYTYQLKAAHCNNLDCTSSTTTTIDNAHYWSIGSATGVDGLPLFVYTRYLGGTSFLLATGHCNTFDCSSYITSTVDAGYIVGKEPSLVIGIDGLGLLTYGDDQLGRDLHTGHCVDIACTAITKAVVDTDRTVGNYSAVAIGADGLPIITHQDSYYYYLKVSHCMDIPCTRATSLILDNSGPYTGPGYRPAITIGSDGNPFIIYYSERDGGLRMIHCGNAFCAPYFRRR